jgi:hypothetical protein
MPILRAKWITSSFGEHSLATSEKLPLRKENTMVEIRNENLVRLLRGLTIAVGNRHNRILIYRFLAAEIRALHYSYGIGDGESYKRALSFLEDCERLTLRSLMRKSAKRRLELTMDHAERVLLRALQKLDPSRDWNNSPFA